jgi:F-type H+-transporting ATPase subunit alpha
VGGKTQLPAYRAVAGDLRLTYSQFEELEKFARFSSQLDADTQATLARGRRVREVFRQPQYHPLSVPEQIASLVAVTSGAMDPVPPEEVARAERVIQSAVRDDAPEMCARIVSGDQLSADDLDHVRQVAEREVTEFLNAEGRQV